MIKKGLFCSQEKGKDLQGLQSISFQAFKYSSIQVFKYSEAEFKLFCSFRRDKKHADSEYHFIVAKSNDISEDLNSVAFHCSSTTKHQGPREEELRLAKQ